MSSITAQQTKLDLELVPKENRLDIGKCNGRIPRGLTPREPTFQVILDAVSLTLCYPSFLITADVLEVYMHQFWNSVYKHDTFYRFKIDKKKRFKLTLEVFRDIFQIFQRVLGRDFDPLPSEEDTVSFLRELGHTGVINSFNDVVVDQMHQPWRTFAALINRGLSGKTSGLDKLHLSRAQILWVMFYQKNIDYVELLWEDFIYQIENRVYKKQEKIPTMKESKAYKTYLSYATGKRVKRPTKKSTTKPAVGVVIREAHVETKSKSKEKEKVDVTHGNGIEFLSDVALTKEAQMKEVRKKSLRDFHKTHHSGSGTVAEKPPSVDKITPTITSEGTGDKPGVPDVTEDDSIENESESGGNDEDDSNNDQDSSKEDSEQENESEEQVSDSEQEEESEDDDQKEEEFVHTPSPTDDKDDDNLETENDDVNKSNEESNDVYKSDEESDDVIKGDKEIVQGKGADAEMIDAQQGNENLKTTQEQVIEDAHVTISTIMKKTEVPITSSSCSSDLASKLL
ncbi:hypothetical protein Tco_1418424, partial [Tanacetum coccineum]